MASWRPRGGGIQLDTSLADAATPCYSNTTICQTMDPVSPPTAAPKSAIATMNETMRSVLDSLANLDGSWSNVGNASPSMTTLLEDIASVRVQFDHAKDEHLGRTGTLKNRIHDELQNEISEQLRADIKAKIRSEIHGQTQAQVDQQITEYIPIPLGKQLEETNTKLSQVKISIANAEARKRNSEFTLTHNKDDKLGVILNDKGKKSDIYPEDLNSFLSVYKHVVQLLADYGLGSDEDPRKNCNRFLDYIGISSATRIYC
ncbi:hypothetical protein CPB85DRAFT_800988 [Mucidula mucida]|nr:hypothetical protein CPB85DRAFT_800988 [Mucidula mucida]